jgi:carboxyl-terminal processing protease
MSKFAKWFILTFSLVLALFTIAGGLGVKASTDDGPYRQMSVLSEVLTRIKGEYVEEPNIPHVTDGALHGLLESLDANSSYLDPAEYKEYKAHKAEGRATIGAVVSKRFGYVAVVSVVPNGPADKVGIEPGDIFESIGSKSTRDMSLAEVQEMLAGQVGSNVDVSVVRARKVEPQKMVITRENVTPPPVTDKTLEDGIGYIKVESLAKGKSQEVASKVKALEKSGAKKLILDLRGTADGEEFEGVATANLFLNHGTIAYLQGQKYPRQTFAAEPDKAITSIPLVVLVNRSTAGPAEIVAAAILENARGDVLGDKTFGMGSVQKLIELPDGGAVILSVAKYYTPTGKIIQDTAVTPNILVADKRDDFVSPDDEDDNVTPDQDTKKKDQGPDEQLNRAIQVLKNNTQKASAATASNM